MSGVRFWKVLSTSVAAVGVGACVYVIVSAAAKPNPTASLIDLRKGAMNKLEVPGQQKPRDVRVPGRDPGVSPAASPPPDIAVTGPDGKPMKIADLKGKVVALSADAPEKTAEAKAFIAKNAPLQPYYSGGSNILFKFQPVVAGLPSTIIYDKKGVERARISGDADWNSKEARQVVERLLAEKG